MIILRRKQIVVETLMAEYWILPLLVCVCVRVCVKDGLLLASPQGEVALLSWRGSVLCRGIEARPVAGAKT